MRHAACAALVSAMVCSSAAAIQINEIRIDQPGTDDDEYFELFGPPGASLDGLTYLVIGDGTFGSGQIEFVLDLTGSTIPANGFFLAAEDGDTFGAAADLVVGLNFENNDNVTHLLVTGFTGANADDLDVDDDGVLDVLPWSGILDGLALVHDAAVPPTRSEFHYASQLGLPAIGPDGSSVPAHVFRLPDGGPFRIGSFDPSIGLDTPGTSNVPEPSGLALLGLSAVLAGYVVRRQRRS